MDKDQIEDDLYENEEDLEEGAHDPMNAEKKSVDSVDKAAKTGPSAKKRHADKTVQDKAEKADKGIVRELYDIMNEMSQDDLRKLRDVLTSEDVDFDETDVLEDVEYDFSNDLTDLVESEATLSEGFKSKASVIMETAIKSKVRAEIARLEESYEEQLAESIDNMQEELVEAVNGYLDYVVENWMEENELAVQNGLRTEIAENFMNGLKTLFTESYIEVPDDKVDLVDDLAEQVEALESELNSRMEETMTMREENEMFKRQAIIFELGEDLADTQLDKLAALAEDVDFDDAETFKSKVATIKEAYFGKQRKASNSTTNSMNEEVDLDDNHVEVDASMQAYLDALRKTANK